MNDVVRYQSQQSPIPYADMEKMAAVIAQSGLFGVKSPVQALALMLVAQAEGLHPATAARDYHVIQGRPALKADAMLARFQAAGGKVEWLTYTETRCEAAFSHPQGGKVTVEWTLEMAKAAGLAGKDVWKMFKRPMLRARVISEGIRTVYPAVLCGLYAPEEVSDMVDVVDVVGSAETNGPDNIAPTVVDSQPSISTIRNKLSKLETVKDQLAYWQELKLDTDHPRFADIKAEFSAARKRIEAEKDKPYDSANAEFVLESLASTKERKEWLAGEKERMRWSDDNAIYVALGEVIKEMDKARKPLNPAPGKAATPESLAAAGFGDGNPTPFDDDLSVIE